MQDVYDIRSAEFTFTARAYSDGFSYPAALANDFEDWRTGTHNWRQEGGTNENRPDPANHSLAFQSKDFDVLGPLELSVGNLWFNTTSLRLVGDVDKAGLDGVVGTTPFGTEVAIFNFDTIYLGGAVNVSFTGDRAIALMSASSVILDAKLDVEPGTLGGFPGGPTLADSNLNGPGSPNYRVYVKTVTVTATRANELQVITTTARAGQTLRGNFQLHFEGSTTHNIPHDASCARVKSYIETGLPNAGRVNVFEDRPRDSQGGRSWIVEFATYAGDVPELRATSLLHGMDARVAIATRNESNTVGGTFTLSWLGATTTPISTSATAAEMADAIVEGIPGATTVYAKRSDPLGICWPGLCENSRETADGNTWVLHLLTRETNVSPKSKTDPLFGAVEPPAAMTADGGGLSGLGAQVTVADNSSASLAFGGAGAAHGGLGGFGHALTDAGFVYGTAGEGGWDDLLGGSGGAGGGLHPWDVYEFAAQSRNASALGGGTVAMGDVTSLFPDPIRGGDGGGALYLSAVNDIFLGNSSSVTAKGGAGDAGWAPGGGGSGGTVIINAGASVAVENGAQVSVSGGSGGTPEGETTRTGSRGPYHGGGGGGGRMAIYSESFRHLEVTGRLLAGVRTNEGVGQGGTTVAGLIAGTASGGTGDGGVANASWAVEAFPQEQVDNFDAATSKARLLEDRYYGEGGEGFAVIKGRRHYFPTLVDEKLQHVQPEEFRVRGGGFIPPAYSGSAQATSAADILRASAGENENTALTSAGSPGAAILQTQSGLLAGIDFTLGAAGTTKALVMTGGDIVTGASGTERGLPHPHNGLQYTLNQESGAVRPERVTYYVQIGDFARGAIGNNIGGHFALYDTENSQSYITVGLAIVDGSFKHGAGYGGLPQNVVQDKIAPDRWYKVDILFRWDTYEYDIRLNDVEMVRRWPFPATPGLSKVGLFTHHFMTVRWDELFLGPDFLMGFECPLITRSGIQMNRPDQYGWPDRALGLDTSIQVMSRHVSVISQRTNYQFNDGFYGVQYGGEGHNAYTNDVLNRNPTIEEGEVLMGAMFTDEGATQDFTNVEPLEPLQMLLGSTTTGTPYGDWTRGKTDLKTSGSTGTHYWFGDHSSSSSLGESPRTGLFGGVGACSTQDYRTWRNEGIMIHYANISDPAGYNGDEILAERPKVVFNGRSGKYIMWMHVDNTDNELGLVGVAESAWPNGPFNMYRTSYPDAPLEAPGGLPINETHDLTILNDPLTNVAYLVRSYYKDVSYLLPRPIMQPLWDSVKNADGDIEFSLNYHRAFYDDVYDDPDNIYLQRWRAEDKPWEIRCCDFTGDCFSNRRIPGEASPAACPDNYRKYVIGQGKVPVESRYLDPLSIDNSFFVPSAVPSHTTWGYQVYNTKTWRSGYFDALMANITHLVFQWYAGEEQRNLENSQRIQHTYPNRWEHVDYILRDSEACDNLLDDLGIRMKREWYDMFDEETFTGYTDNERLYIDSNEDGLVYPFEFVAIIGTWMYDSVSQARRVLMESLVYEERERQKDILDRNADGVVNYTEFATWIDMRDINVQFDTYDLDKGGYLDEEEIARVLADRHVPRFARHLINLDPDFDGRIWFEKFANWMNDAPSWMFNLYDIDRSDTLSEAELAELTVDMGANIDQDALLLLRDGNGTIDFDRYQEWFRGNPSQVHKARKQLKADNKPFKTLPDRLVGPQQVVETRRAKYVAISVLTEDYLATEGLLLEQEGEFENEDDLISLIGFESFAELFGIDSSLGAAQSSSERPHTVPYSSDFLGHLNKYYNGREFEGRPAAPPVVLYGEECVKASGTTKGCPECLNHSPYLTMAQEAYRSSAGSFEHCQSNKLMDEYIKSFDQMVSVPLRYQQRDQAAVVDPSWEGQNAGIQPDYTPCLSGTEGFPCDVCQNEDGDTIECLWVNHPLNVPRSNKINYGNSYDNSVQLQRG